MNKCDKCRREFPSPSKLRTHLLRKTPCDKVRITSFFCLDCERSFATKGNLKKHQAKSCPKKEKTGFELLSESMIELRNEISELKALRFSREQKECRSFRQEFPEKGKEKIKEIESPTIPNVQNILGIQNNNNILNNTLNNNANIINYNNLEEAGKFVTKDFVIPMLDKLAKEKKGFEEILDYSLTETAKISYLRPESPVIKSAGEIEKWKVKHGKTWNTVESKLATMGLNFNSGRRIQSETRNTDHEDLGNDIKARSGSYTGNQDRLLELVKT